MQIKKHNELCKNEGRYDNQGVVINVIKYATWQAELSQEYMDDAKLDPVTSVTKQNFMWMEILNPKEDVEIWPHLDNY